MFKGLGGSRERSPLDHLVSTSDGTGGQWMHLQYTLHTSVCRCFALINLTVLKENAHFMNSEVACGKPIWSKRGWGQEGFIIKTEAYSANIHLVWEWCFLTITQNHNYLLCYILQPDLYCLGEDGMWAGAERFEESTLTGVVCSWCQCTFIEGIIWNGVGKQTNQTAKRLCVLSLLFFFPSVKCVCMNLSSRGPKQEDLLCGVKNCLWEREGLLL